MSFALFFKSFFLLIVFLFNNHTIFKNCKNKNIINNNIKTKGQRNKIIEENFFIIDSNNLNHILPHMYGFCVSEKGILTDNYYKQLGKYIEPEPQGVYIMIRKIGNKIILNQDFSGSFGIYIYENKKDNYFALSNSFLFLEEYLVDKQNISFNKDFADNFIITNLCTYSIYETLINEIIQIPSNSYLIIDIDIKKIYIHYVDYQQNTIPLESKEGLEIIDKWVDKWGFILRSLKKKTDNISYDLSGGFDTRTLLTILLNSDINPNELLINTIVNKEHGHDEDFKIAKNISSKYGFKINSKKLDKIHTKFSLEDILFISLYSKLGFHKEFYLKSGFLKNPRFSFSGSGGEHLRGYPGSPIKKFTDSISYQNILNHQQEFYDSSIRLLNRSISLIKKKQKFDNDYEISFNLYSYAVGKNHFGKAALEAFLANIYFLQPLMDPDIKKIKYNINCKDSHDLIAYIYIRFAHDLIHFPFQGKRLLNLKSIKNAENLNNKFKQYKIKTNYNIDFFIDLKRTIYSENKRDQVNVNAYLSELFNSNRFIRLIIKKYDKQVYKWAKDYSNKSNYFPFRHEYGLLAIAMTIENLILNKIYMDNSYTNNRCNSKKLIENII